MSKLQEADAEEGNCNHEFTTAHGRLNYILKV